MPEIDLDRLKQDIPIDELARQLGLEVKNNKIRCFNFANHNNGDKKPSLSLDLKTNRFKCFACGVRGSVIDLYKEIKGVETGEAIKELSLMSGLNTFTAPKKVIESKEPEISTKGLYEGLQGFCKGLDAESLSYLTGITRGLTRETIDRFKMFSIKDYGEANKYLKDNFSREQLESAGLVSDEGNLIFYKHKVIIPFYESGEITFLQARRLDSDQPRYLMLKGRACPLFNTDTLKPLKQGDRVYICEGVFDAVILEQAGYKAIAILGVNNFKREMLSLFSGLDVVLCLDSDEAGQRATEALSGLFLLNGQVVKRKVLPAGIKDITEYFIK